MSEQSDMAFPLANPLTSDQLGMTLRDYFAAKAIQGFCANSAIFAENGQTGWGLVNCNLESLTSYAFDVADSMMKAKEK
jgi:hypothetical protein